MALNPPWTRPDTETCVRCDHAPKFHRPSCHRRMTWQHLWRRCSCGGLRPAGNVTRDGRPGSKSAIYRVEDRALSGCEAGVSVGSALWRFAVRAPGLSGLALAVRPAGSAEAPALKGGSRRSFLRSG